MHHPVGVAEQREVEPFLRGEFRELVWPARICMASAVPAGSSDGRLISFCVPACDCSLARVPIDDCRLCCAVLSNICPVILEIMAISLPCRCG
jgi:hypothetical protein